MATPGHTPACVSYRIGDAVFVGDTLFMPDYGTARADFPGGDARQLYRSIQRILALPRETRLFVCHDYKAPDRDVFAWETTVGEELDGNVHIHAGVSEEEFVAMRTARDATLLREQRLGRRVMEIDIVGVGEAELQPPHRIARPGELTNADHLLAFGDRAPIDLGRIEQPVVAELRRHHLITVGPEIAQALV